MLEGRQALDLALDLARAPTLVPAMRAHPLPPDVLVLIRIAAGCQETCRAAVSATGRTPSVITEACIFYLQQILFAPEADSHRVLGVQPGASRKTMRDHMRWLLKWLHPDRNGADWESVFATRVLKAWRDVSAGGRQDPTIEEPAAQSGRFPSTIHRWIELPLSEGGGVSRRKQRLAAIIMATGVIAGLIVVLSIFPHNQRSISSPITGAEEVAAE